MKRLIFNVIAFLINEPFKVKNEIITNKQINYVKFSKRRYV